MPNISVQLRRGTDTEHSSFTGAEGEVTVDTTNNTLRVHDNSTAGGIRLAKLSEAGLSAIANLSVLGNVSGASAVPVAVDIKDDDTMATASATSLATSESIKAYVDSNAGIPTGTVSAFAGNTAPTGYVLCDGSAVNRTTQAALFAVIGTTYGVGDGSTTFNLPDLRGRVVAGMGGSLSSGTDALADTGGASTHTLTENEMPSHSHGIGGIANDMNLGTSSFRLSPTVSSIGDTKETGGDQPHNNVQPTIILNYIIKT